MNPKEAEAHLSLDGHPSASLASAIELVSEAYQAVALAEQRTRDAEKHSDIIQEQCSAQLKTAERLARACEIRAERAERRAAVLASCLREIFTAVSAEAEAHTTPTVPLNIEAEPANTPGLSTEATLRPDSPFFGEAMPHRDAE